MSKIKFDLYTYQFRPTSNIQLGLFDKELKSPEDIMKNKNKLFEEVFKDDLKLIYRKKDLSYRKEYFKDHLILLRIANKKRVAIEQSFHREVFESEPSCLVFINNNPDKQYIAIESDRESFGKSKTVMNLIANNIKDKLERLNLQFKFNVNYKEREFWNLVSEFEDEIEIVKFSLNYPNLPRSRSSVKKDLEELMKSTSSDAKLELKAEKGDVLTNLREDNEQLNSLVKASANSGEPIKVKTKGDKKYKKTGKDIESLNFDDLDLNLNEEMKKLYIDDLKNQIDEN